jgi:HAD superfamily hydrolase (TIGR01484 family)
VCTSKSTKEVTGNKAAIFQVKAIFTDYDGTLSPINVSRAQSAIPPKTLTALVEISKHIPVAIITTKDLKFVAKRTPFASAWATLGGLEITLNGVTEKAPCIQSKLSQIKAALDQAKALAGDVLAIEEKKDAAGNSVAFSVDSRQTKNKAQALGKASKILAICEQLGLSITRYVGQPFFDVFPCPINKGAALETLKLKLNLHDGVLYIGDSAADNAAFRKSDLAVGVLHEETARDLECTYFVKFEALSAFLEHLLAKKFCFSPDWSMLKDREEAFSPL